VSYKSDSRQWITIDLENYRFSCNGQEPFTAHQMSQIGTYSALIGDSQYYNSSLISFEEGHAAFLHAMGEGFAWELLEVYSGPPNITFRWRHFGRMTDSFSCRSLSGHLYTVDPTKKMINIYGMCKMTVTADMKIQELQIFYDPNQLFTQLAEICPFAPFETVSSLYDPAKEKMLNELLQKKALSGKPETDDEKEKEKRANRSSTMCIIN
ncbi:unnamed protein product, partial [Rotaria sp. Silwood2]